MMEGATDESNSAGVQGVQAAAADDLQLRDQVEGWLALMQHRGGLVRVGVM